MAVIGFAAYPFPRLPAIYPPSQAAGPAGAGSFSADGIKLPRATQTGGRSAEQPPHMEQYTSSMSTYDDSNFRDRRSRASEAKSAILEKFKRANDPDSPAAIEKRRQREAIASARAEREAKREALRQEQEREWARQTELAAAAAAEAERLAAEERAHQATEAAAREAELKAEQKAARDARYAARKAAKKRRRRGL
jgi:Family of unknown function (DUF6481)